MEDQLRNFQNLAPNSLGLRAKAYLIKWAHLLLLLLKEGLIMEEKAPWVLVGFHKRIPRVVVGCHGKIKAP